MDAQQCEQIAQRMLSQQVSLGRFYGKFTEKARTALALAYEEAGHFNHSYIGTEHLLLGLLHEGTGVAAMVLHDLGIEAQTVRTFVERVVKRGEALPEDTARPLTPRTQVVLLMAIGETWRSSFIGTEHILLGITREGEGLAAAALETLGAPLEQVRMRTFQAIASHSPSLEPLKDIIQKTKGNVVTCRIDDQDLAALDALIEVGIRSTRSDAAAWLIHAGIQANQALFASVYSTVAEIRNLRTRAQALAQMVTQNQPATLITESEEAPASEVRIEKEEETR